MGSARWTIVGVLASKGSTGTTDENAVALVPYTSAEDQLTGYTASFNELIVEVKKLPRRRRSRGRNRDHLGLGQQNHGGRSAVPAAQREQPAVDLAVHQRDLHCPARRSSRHLVAGRRDRHYEHHAGDGHRTDPRGIGIERRSEPLISHPVAVFDRGRHPVVSGWGGRGGGRLDRQPFQDCGHQARGERNVDHRSIRSGYRHRSVLRLLSSSGLLPCGPSMHCVTSDEGYE